MKKSLLVLAAAGLSALVACGPSAEEQAKMEQARQDSINAVIEQARLDSIASAEAAALEQARQDSIAMADSLAAKAMEDSLAAASKPKPKPKPKKPTKPTEWKAGQGKG